jgi:hypothetical protein
VGEQVVHGRALGQLDQVAVRRHPHERERTRSHASSRWPILVG